MQYRFTFILTYRNNPQDGYVMKMSLKGGNWDTHENYGSQYLSQTKNSRISGLF